MLQVYPVSSGSGSSKRKQLDVRDVYDVEDMFSYRGDANAPVMIVTDKGTVDKKNKKARTKRQTQAAKTAKAESPAVRKRKLSPRTLHFCTNEPRESRFAACEETKKMDAHVKWAHDHLKGICGNLDEQWTVPPRVVKTKEEKEEEDVVHQYYAFTTLSKLYLHGKISDP